MNQQILVYILMALLACSLLLNFSALRIVLTVAKHIARRDAEKGITDLPDVVGVFLRLLFLIGKVVL